MLQFHPDGMQRTREEMTAQKVGWTDYWDGATRGQIQAKDQVLRPLLEHQAWNPFKLKANHVQEKRALDWDTQEPGSSPPALL
jgi:hypothetical protein